MRILFIGDVIGRPGRRAVEMLLPGLRQEYVIDLVIANGENVAGGFGLTSKTAQELLRSSVDVITSGNHIWDQQEIISHMNGELPVLRPINYPKGVPGHGHQVLDHNGHGVVVANAIGRVFVGNFDDPFTAMDELLDTLDSKPKVILLDFHAEATSEKAALAWYLDGRVSAVIGTHTHVATADCRILPKGTAFASDAGMTGPINSIIGSKPEDVLTRFLTQMPHRLNIASGPVQFNSVLVDVNEETGSAREIFRIDRELE